MCMYARNEEWGWWWDGAGCWMPMLLCAYTVMLCVTVSNKDGGWGGIVITLFDTCFVEVVPIANSINYVCLFNHLVHMYFVVFRSTLSLTCSRRSVKMLLSDCAWMRTLLSSPILPHRSAGSHQQIDQLLYNQLLPRHLVTTPIPQLMSRTPQWLLQSMIMIIRMFARVYFCYLCN